MNIHELSEYHLYQLKSIDPALSSEWQTIIKQILPKLNKESQSSVYKNILQPRGIHVDANKKLVSKKPTTLRDVREHLQTNNKDLVSIALRMSKIISPNIKEYDASELADEIEAGLNYLDNLDIGDLLSDQKNRNDIRIAFLYELAGWIDNVSLKVKPGLRQLDQKIVKAYLKEVFIKQQIRGRDFRSWDSSDAGFQELTHLPEFIKKEGKNRKFFVVEGQKHWFLIGSPNQYTENPYSIRRFLYEDSSGDDNKKYVYLTHVTLIKEHMDHLQYMAHATYCMTRLYTLDRGVSGQTHTFQK